MPGKILYMAALYDFTADSGHIAVAENQLKSLQAMADRLAGTDDLAAIYIPKTTDSAYRSDRRKTLNGKIAGTVRLLPMPEGKSPADYHYEDVFTSRRRWPHGWPSRVVHSPPAEDCELLEDILFRALPKPVSLADFTLQFQKGPICLDDFNGRKLGQSILETMR